MTSAINASDSVNSGAPGEQSSLNPFEVVAGSSEAGSKRGLFVKKRTL